MDVAPCYKWVIGWISSLVILIKICTSTRQPSGYKLEETIWSSQLALVRPHAEQSRTYSWYHHMHHTYHVPL